MSGKNKKCPVCSKKISSQENYCSLACEEKDKKERWYDAIFEFFDSWFD